MDTPANYSAKAIVGGKRRVSIESVWSEIKPGGGKLLIADSDNVMNLEQVRI